ncbi:MAG: MFS transporter [Deltaproteobacteria bacterium]|nr:MFS transporter [Deltaproteobacteria bacterium]
MSGGPRLPRAVFLLGAVSLLADVASDLAFPLLPLFLEHELHARNVALGAIEGLADATAAGVKYLAGLGADRGGKRKPFVLGGYALSGLAKPLLALALAPWHVVALRMLDRVGKGLRTAPRDALIAEATPEPLRARAFGLHRALDNLGAVLGPLAAALVLHRWPGAYRLAFALTVFPGLATVLLVALGVREGAVAVKQPAYTEEAPLPPALRRYLLLTGLFTLANASDVFVLVRARQLGAPEASLPLLWGGLSLLRALCAAPGGALADRLGRPRALCLGWALYAVAWAAFGVARSPLELTAVLGLYGVYYGLTEGAQRAVVATLAPGVKLGRAYGAFHLVTGLLALPASLGFGWALETFGPARTFGAGGALALLASLGMARLLRTH